MIFLGLLGLYHVGAKQTSCVVKMPGMLKNFLIDFITITRCLQVDLPQLHPVLLFVTCGF